MSNGPQHIQTSQWPTLSSSVVPIVAQVATSLERATIENQSPIIAKKLA